MGKLGRFAAIFIPMALTIASLICLSIVCVGQSNKDMDLANDLYFFKAITKDVDLNPNEKAGEKVNEANDKLKNLPNSPQFNEDLLKALQGSAKSNKLTDFYKVGIRGYCEGKIDGDKEIVEKCSDQVNYFWFNPIEVWGLEGTSAQNMFSDEFKKGLDSYKKVAKWMVTCYGLALAATALEILIGITALFSRWGSLATTIVSCISSGLAFSAALTITLLYSSLVGIFETVLKPYNIDSEMGKQMLSVLWLGVAFSLGSGIFWLFSTCCCSGKSDKKKVKVEKTPYTYERVASPYLGASANNSHQMHPVAPHGGHGAKFEPYRNGH
ncbi:unnamed protein product [Periconia digitata]|uniref:Integral membrane protein-like protein n=1 Tax=Periconia digitata TaxID=1303443 RepID=A0A9W4UGV3_9PLEO|nr:unnamed protein product [Periconia digitata]